MQLNLKMRIKMLQDVSSWMKMKHVQESTKIYNLYSVFVLYSSPTMHDGATTDGENSIELQIKT